MKRTPIRRISKKMIQQKKVEGRLIECLLQRSGGLCEICKKQPDWRGLSKHEIKSRAQGGDPTDPSNCQLLCGKCHSARGGIKEVSYG